MSLNSVLILGRRMLGTDLRPANSILSAVATAWDLDVSRRAAKIGEKGASRKELQTNRQPPKIQTETLPVNWKSRS